MLHLVGTVEDTLLIKESLNSFVLDEIIRIVSILDLKYGEDRDIMLSDGGYVLIVEAKEDLKTICNNFLDIYKRQFEQIDVLKNDSNYVNAFYLIGNEFSINIIMPKSIALPSMLNELIEEGKI